MTELEAALEIERILLNLQSPTDEELKLARLSVRAVFQDFSKIEIDKSLTLFETIERIAFLGEKKARRSSAIFIIRLNSEPGFFPKHVAGTNADAKIITLLEPSLPDFYKRFSIEEKEQTYIKLDKLYAVHEYCCDKLRCLKQIPANIEGISAEKQMILRSLGDSTVKSYLAPYEYSKIRSAVEAILAQVVAFSASADTTFNRKLKELLDLLNDELIHCDDYKTFVTEDFYRFFLETIKCVVESEAERAKERFVCEVISRKGCAFTLDKKYPLSRSNEEVRLFIPLYNSGPGIADRVNASINTSSQNVLLHVEEVDLGGVGPGEFVLPVSFTVYEPVESLKINILVSWMIIGDSEEKLIDLSVEVKSQSANIDWDSLSNLNPYSLDIATGLDFYGRKDKVGRLVSRVSRGKMQSSYITGQRRVGKSSLAKAVEDKVLNNDLDCYVLNIECGDFKHPDAISTINSLGENIEYFLSSFLPQDAKWSPIGMNGSLATLSRLAGTLERLDPNKRFLIIIDEFDEINQELYRFSEIAETFFLNIRSLSSKKNICFCLIGAERMSFVMSSQGEKLNKFFRESLDTFKQEEWEDYEDLVKANLSSSITWLDNSIRYLYSITYGHPYFTKQICAKVFDDAISSRDAEITDEEVKEAVNSLIPELDVNAFQHFWRDGILGNLDEVEIITLKRCRVLVGFARVKRLGLEPNVENIKLHIHSGKISEVDVLPILMDFCRRGIMFEYENKYNIEIPLFESWLVNQGFSSLIADQLGDELAEKKQKEEDNAYVKDIEIASLLQTWPSYKGIQITPTIVREWLAQVESHIQQRILFKLLSNLRFFGEAEVRKMFKNMHERNYSQFKLVVKTSKAQRRKDIWITYVDGPSKSGAQFAAYYAQENLISTTCIKEMSEINSLIKKSDFSSDQVSTVVVVDDFIGSGDNLSSGMRHFHESNGHALKNASVNVLVAVVCATKDGEDMVRGELTSLDAEYDLIVCETLSSSNIAFDSSNSIWSDESEMFAAKDLCQRLGVRVDKNHPLGYKDQGLLVVFSRNCPNNTLPIMHSTGRGGNLWNPLFERVKH
ncbi:ATP-binding protein [Halomonas sp. G11]|uniref:phosphoribosyltransferase-like protein n=1 Tax=Halomonas sp. G11 TaxID=1684425 RepID=UPI0007FDEF3C|nr:ATP-binding protein [Halomonas sp. G11]OAZ91382.1 hypothetical protein ADS46_05925 [Halomonas sp. G11]